MLNSALDAMKVLIVIDVNDFAISCTLSGIYRGGWTHTAGAAQCACNYVFSDECGFDESNACIDVIVVTDGRSNDPSLEVCEEIQCLRNAPHLQNAQVSTLWEFRMESMMMR